MISQTGKKKSRQKQESFLFVLMGFILLGLMISGYFLFVDKILPEITGAKESGAGGAGGIPSANLGKSPDSRVLDDPALLEGEGQVVTLFFPARGKDCLVREMRKIPAEKMVLNQAVAMINELIRGPMMSDARPAFPAGTQIRSIFFHQGVFFVDFSKEFADLHPGGAMEEALSVYSLVNTLTELDKKAKVKILLNGEEKETIKGHANIQQPLVRYESLAVNLSG